MKPFILMQSSFLQKQPRSHHHHPSSKIATVRPMGGGTMKLPTAKVTEDAILAGTMAIFLQIADKLSASIVVRRAT